MQALHGVLDAFVQQLRRSRLQEVAAVQELREGSPELIVDVVEDLGDHGGIEHRVAEAGCRSLRRRRIGLFRRARVANTDPYSP